ncbi:MAG: thioredoxin domain-containing protein [Candidatus Paceibacterota bacterium]|jgi:protein-disulfide isomerase
MENTKQFKITTPVAIVIAGFLVMVGIILTNNMGGSGVTKEKTLSEQVGVSKEKFAACVEAVDSESLADKIQTSVESAMKAVPADQRGTPYSVIVGSNGVKTEIRGAESYESIEKAISEVLSGTVATKYEGEIPPVDATDHVWGNSTAQVTIIEYSDFECPYCKSFHTTLKKVVDNSAGNVNWVYRHWPIHQNSFEKLVAAECIAQIKGNDAFWKYTDLLFGLLKTSADPVTNL